MDEYILDLTCGNEALRMGNQIAARRAGNLKAQSPQNQTGLGSVESQTSQQKNADRKVYPVVEGPLITILLKKVVEVFDG